MATTDHPDKDAWGRKRTPYAVNCLGPFDIENAGHGLVYLTDEEYELQLLASGRGWRCPICNYDAEWDDSNFEQMTYGEAA